MNNCSGLPVKFSKSMHANLMKTKFSEDKTGLFYEKEFIRIHMQSFFLSFFQTFGILLSESRTRS